MNQILLVFSLVVYFVERYFNASVFNFIYGVASVMYYVISGFYNDPFQ